MTGIALLSPTETPSEPLAAQAPESRSPGRPTARGGDAWGRRLDLAERLIVAALYLWLAARVAASVARGGTVFNLLLLASEGLVVVFLLARRPSRELSRSPVDWGLALAATAGPLLIRPSTGEPLVPPAVAAVVWCLGTLVQVWAKLSLGRSFGCVPAHRGLRLGGPYRLVRHPMYAGYLLGHVAAWLLNPTAGNLALFAACDALLIPRLLAEERLLGRDPSYRLYRAEVRSRLVPGVF